MFVLTQFFTKGINETILSGALIYSLIYIYILMYQDTLLPIFNKFFPYVLTIDLLLFGFVMYTKDVRESRVNNSKEILADVQTPVQVENQSLLNLNIPQDILDELHDTEDDSKNMRNEAKYIGMMTGIADALDRIIEEVNVEEIKEEANVEETVEEIKKEATVEENIKEISN